VSELGVWYAAIVTTVMFGFNGDQLDRARIFGNATLADNAEVYEDAMISGNVRLCSLASAARNKTLSKSEIVTKRII